MKSATPEQRAAVSQVTGVSFAPRPEKLPAWLRLTPNLFSKASAARFQAEAKFFDDYRRLIRGELGSKALLTLSNDHNDGLSGSPHLRGNLRGDWIDGHGYWEHPTIGAETRSKNTPMVNDPLDSTVTQSARSPVAGRPFTIGEVNHPFPHRFAAEGYPILAAQAQLHDWDGIAWFDWEKGRLQDCGVGVQKNGWFDVSNDPVKLAQLATCALMWHRHDVAPAKATHLRVISESAAVESLPLFQERPFFQPGFDLATPLSPEGRPASEPRNAEAAGADWKIKLGTPPTTWWEIELQR